MKKLRFPVRPCKDLKFEEDSGFISKFTPEEIKILIKYGGWLDELSSGRILPESEAQQQFLDVCGGAKKPTTNFEIIWLKVIDRRASREVERLRRIEAQKRNDERFSPEGLKKESLKIKKGEGLNWHENRPYDQD